MRLFDAKSSHWAVRHYYVFIIIAGIIVFLSAGPVSSLYQLSDEEYAKMAEYTLSTGLPYKGKDFLEWRYGPLGVLFFMWSAALALVLAGTVIGGLRLGLDPLGTVFNFFKLKHTAAGT